MKRTQTKTYTQKRESAYRALERIQALPNCDGSYNTTTKQFVETAKLRLQSNSHLDSVLSDIACARNSFTVQKKLNEDWIKEEIRVWKTVAYITFTFSRPENYRDRAAKKYLELVEDISEIIFKHAYRRYNKKIKHFAVIEGNNDEHRRHLHAIVEIPDKQTVDSFKALIQKRWSYGNVDCLEIGRDEADINNCIGYLLKGRTKEFSEDLLVH